MNRDERLEFCGWLSDQIKKQKKIKKFSYRGLAKELGISPTYLVKFTSGIDIPSHDRYMDLCELLEIIPKEYPKKDTLQSLRAENRKLKLKIEELEKELNG